MPSFSCFFQNTYASDLTDFFVDWQPETAPQPTLLHFNASLASELGMTGDFTDADGLAQVFSGNALLPGSRPIAQVYAGHQFGGFSPQLGDGRALLLGEVITPGGQRHDLAFKGSGRTPYSRGGDGKAAVGPMLRELIVGEAMHALGIPTTRALAVVATGAPVYRDTTLPGAVLTRVADSHIRVGTFEYFSARRQTDRLLRLARYTLARHDPGLSGLETPWVEFFRAVAQRQARLIAQWMQVGFIHGVMNTDNMTLSGQTIDYGPCAFMEAYHPDTVFSSIDVNGRYAYTNQPAIAQWNLARLAECLLPLLPDEEAGVTALSAELESFWTAYEHHWLAGMRRKAGLAGRGEADQADQADQADAALLDDWLTLLREQRVDFTLAWRYLADEAEPVPPQGQRLHALFADRQALEVWLSRWRERCRLDDATGERAAIDPRQQATTRAASMRAVNPWLIARNHQVEAALAAASSQLDMGPTQRLLQALAHPFEENPVFADLAQPAPASEAACYKTFCGT